LDLKNSSNRELLRLFRLDLALRYHGDQSFKEADRVVTRFSQFLGDRPPSTVLATEYLSQFRDRRPNTRARYTILVGQFMKWYGEPLDVQVRQPKMLPQGLPLSIPIAKKG
jgi:hypothetical protein